MTLRRPLTALTAGLAWVSLGGCGLLKATAESYAVTPQGLEVREDQLRRDLPFAGGDSARRRIPATLLPKDSLLRALYAGTWAYYAGDYAEAAKGLEAASDLTEDRYTKSLSQNAAALFTNDLALDYMPGYTERLLTPLYAALGYNANGDRSGSAVEARRLGALLERLKDSTSDRERPTRAFLRYATGALFEAAGDANDAGVSYRNARALLGADSTLVPDGTSIPADSGDVVVLVEQGYVAHKVAQDLMIPLYEKEAKSFSGDGKLADQLAVSATIAGRVFLVSATQPNQGLYWVNGQPMVVNSWGRFGTAQPIGSTAYVLKLSWTVLRPTVAPVALSVSAGGRVAQPIVAANLNEAQAADLSRDRVPRLTREIARQAVKLATSEAAEAKARKKWGNTTGDIIGGLFNAAGALLERADTRGWMLLPAGIVAVRLRLPVGTHELKASYGSQARALGPVTVRGGRLTVVARRLWSAQVLATAPR